MSDVLRITLLGTGIPFAPGRAYGTATLVEAGGQKVLLDCGRGAVIRLAQAGHRLGEIQTVILSHFHSDHYTGLFDLVMTGALPQWFAARGAPLHVYGPPGVERIATGAWEAATPDREIRVADSEIDPEHMRIVPHVYEEGPVYKRDGLVIRAILVDHGEFVKPAYAFRVEYRGHVFVHSHDTRYNENLIAQSAGADVMVHEIAACPAEILARTPALQVVIDHHATPTDVGRVFARVRPRLALLTHVVLIPPGAISIETVLEDLGAEYDGPVLVAEDLMTIQIGKTVSVIPHRSGARPG